jgi:hypothetical protein
MFASAMVDAKAHWNGTAAGDPMLVLNNDRLDVACGLRFIDALPGKLFKAASTGRCLAASFAFLVASALPFPAAAQDTSPSGMVAFFMSSGAGCPTGWTVATSAQGRLLVGVADTSAVGVVVDNPMLNQTDPQHDHGYYPSVTLPVKKIAAIHCCNKQGAQSGPYTLIKSVGPPRVASVFTQASTSNLPFIQLVICQKQ